MKLIDLIESDIDKYPNNLKLIDYMNANLSKTPVGVIRAEPYGFSEPARKFAPRYVSIKLVLRQTRYKYCLEYIHVGSELDVGLELEYGARAIELLARHYVRLLVDRAVDSGLDCEVIDFIEGASL